MYHQLVRQNIQLRNKINNIFLIKGALLLSPFFSMANVKIYKHISRLLDSGKDGILATILNTRGSTPAGSMSKMFAIEGGPQITGTVGGGRIEADIIKEACGLFSTGKTIRQSYSMHDDDIEGGVICGGEIDVLIEFVESDYSGLYSLLYERCLSGMDSVVGTIINTVTNTSRKFLAEPDLTLLSGVADVVDFLKEREFGLFKKNKAAILNIEDNEVILEPVKGLSSLIIFGGGHISKHLADFAERCDFTVTIVDDRPEFASRERFSRVEKVVCSNFRDSFSKLTINDKSYIVIVTRGHSWDEVVLERALKTNAGYIGMIGSRKKIRTLYNNIISRSNDINCINRIFAPIGMDIGARTPETIAVSIIAELIKIRELGNDEPVKHLKDSIKGIIHQSE